MWEWHSSGQQSTNWGLPDGNTFPSEMTSWPLTTMLKSWHYTRNTTSSVDGYLLGEQSCQISSWCDLKQRILRLFWRGQPNKKNESSDVRCEISSWSSKRSRIKQLTGTQLTTRHFLCAALQPYCGLHSLLGTTVFVENFSKFCSKFSTYSN